MNTWRIFFNNFCELELWGNALLFDSDFFQKPSAFFLKLSAALILSYSSFALRGMRPDTCSLTCRKPVIISQAQFDAHLA